jgi:hypothetical protein
MLAISSSPAQAGGYLFQAWRDQEAWTAEKYRRFDCGERMPPDWKPPGTNPAAQA